MVDKIGDYEVRVGGAAASFWPLAPGTTVAASTPPAGGVDFAIFDIQIETSDPAVKTAVADPAFVATVAAASVKTMPLVPEIATELIHIAFAVPTAGGNFTGVLRLTVQRQTSAGPVATHMEIPLSIATGALADRLFVFFVVHPNPPLRFVWTQLQVVDQANPATAVDGATGTVRVLRDNSTFKDRNRRFDVTTDANGWVSRTGTARNVLGLMVGWPQIVELGRLEFVSRSHLVKLAPQNPNDNLAPFVATAMRMTRGTDASLATKTILLDAGHGVVYGLPAARRSQEWYVAHKVIDAVATRLKLPPFNVPDANIFRTRSAGFAMIDPANPTAAKAPELGDAKFAFDLPQRRVRAIQGALTLKDLSDLLLVRHDRVTAVAQPVTDLDRMTILIANPIALAAIITRLAAAGTPARDGTIRWDAASNDYLYTNDKTGADTHLPIETGDWFTLSDTHFEILAERAVIWSLTAEISSDGAGNAATGLPAFFNAVHDTMIADGAFEYMKAQVLMYSSVAPPHEWLNHGTKAWAPVQRNAYFNATPCDLYISIHENSGGGIGGTALVALPTVGVDAPPDDQIRKGKFFLKYVDGFDQGLRRGGVSQEEPTNPATMLRHTNQIREKYFYLESEFMDLVKPASPTRYQIQDMIDRNYVADLADQIVRGIAEILIDPQSDMDTITLNGTFSLW
jgi:N-acetylmuramoyl-L-alanine amidase